MASRGDYGFAHRHSDPFVAAYAQRTSNTRLESHFCLGYVQVRQTPPAVARASRVNKDYFKNVFAQLFGQSHPPRPTHTPPQTGLSEHVVKAITKLNMLAFLRTVRKRF